MFALWWMLRALHRTEFARISADAATNSFPLGFARDSRLAGWISGAGLGGAKRIHSPGLACIPFFARSEACGTRHASRARIPGLDVRLVSPDRHRRQCHLLLCDFCLARLSRRSPPLRTKLATPALPANPGSPALLHREYAAEKRPVAL